MFAGYEFPYVKQEITLWTESCNWNKNKESFILVKKNNSSAFQISYHTYMLDKYWDNSLKMHYVCIMYYISTHEQTQEKIIIHFVP